MNDITEHVVILAAGLGQRMRREKPAVELDAEAARVADSGCKAMIPMGRPFIDYLAGALVDAGFRRLTFVVGPDHDELRRHVADLNLALLKHVGAQATTSVQKKPRGTADAVAAAREAVEEAEEMVGDSFVVVNSDNYYPASALVELNRGTDAALVAYDRDALVAQSNIPAERIARFAVLDIAEDGTLRRVVEKPEDPEAFARKGRLAVSMNTWRFDATIFEACHLIKPNPVRGELELTDAVQYAIDHLDVRFRCLPCSEGVLDLTDRADVGPVARALTNRKLSF